jgi:membrane protein required for colicin V production
MSAFDIIIFTVLSVFTVIGIWKGFFREIFGFLGVIFGALFAILGFGPLSKLLHRLVPDIPAFIWIFLSFIIIFVGFYILSRFLASMLSKLSKIMLLGWLNRLLGGAVGFLKGALFVSLFLLLIGFLPFQDTLQKVRSNSWLYEPMQRTVPIIYNLFSDFSFSSRNLEKKMTELMEDIEGKMNENVIKYFLYKDK